MDDLIQGCLDDLGERDVRAFQETFCQRCRNPGCSRAKWAEDKFGGRITHQVDRLFNPLQVDGRAPKYAIIMDFPDMLREALRLEVSDKRGNWEVPEIPVLDGQSIVATTSVSSDVDRAIQQLAASRGHEIALPDPIVDEDPVVVPTEMPVVYAPPTAPTVRGNPGNTSVPDEGIMIGGPVPESPVRQPVVDPWAVVPKVNIVPRGAKIRLGGSSDG